MKHLPLYFFVGVTASLLLFYGAVCFAQEEDRVPDKGLQISPLRFDWKMRSGEARSDQITVHNFSDISHEVEVIVENFSVSDDSSQAFFYDAHDRKEEKVHDITSWFSFPKTFVLAPDETKIIPFEIRVPDGQLTDGYYGAIFFKTYSDDVSSERQGENIDLNVNYRVGALVTLAVQGSEKMEKYGSLEKFSSSRKIYWSSPMEIFAQLESQGNVHYAVDGEIDVFRFNERFSNIKVSSQILYPNKKRTIEKPVQFNWSDVGIYHAVLDLRSDDSEVVFYAKTPWFIVLPWQPVLLVAGMGVFVIMTVRFLRRNYKIVKKDHS
jgi:hypothetical protein